MKKLIMAIGSIAMLISYMAFAHEHVNMKDACKTECPKAKTEDEAHTCMDGVAKKKAGDKKFIESKCFHAYQEHEKEEKESAKH